MFFFFLLEGEGKWRKERSLPSVLPFNLQREKVALLLLSLLGEKSVLLQCFSFRTRLHTVYKHTSFDFSQYLQIACAEENKLDTLRKLKDKEE